MLSVDMLLRQHKAHTSTLANGDKLIGMSGGVWDLFSGQGFSTPIRFRIIKFRDKTKPNQLLQISGETTLSREYRNQLLKDLSYG